MIAHWGPKERCKIVQISNRLCRWDCALAFFPQAQPRCSGARRGRRVRTAQHSTLADRVKDDEDARRTRDCAAGMGMRSLDNRQQQTAADCRQAAQFSWPGMASGTTAWDGYEDIHSILHSTWQQTGEVAAHARKIHEYRLQEVSLSTARATSCLFLFAGSDSICWRRSAGCFLQWVLGRQQHFRTQALTRILGVTFPLGPALAALAPCNCMSNAARHSNSETLPSSCHTHKHAGTPSRAPARPLPPSRACPGLSPSARPAPGAPFSVPVVPAVATAHLFSRQPWVSAPARAPSTGLKKCPRPADRTPPLARTHPLPQAYIHSSTT